MPILSLSLRTGLAVISLVLFGLLQAAPRSASASVWQCDHCTCDCTLVGGGMEDSIPFPPEGSTDTDGTCNAACEQICPGIADADANAIDCEEVSQAPAACECCSGSRLVPPADGYRDVMACETACERRNGVRKYGAQTFECAAGAAPPPAGAGAASATQTPQAPINYEQGAVVVNLENPLGTTSIPALIGRIINAFLGLAGSIAILMVVYGGVTWLTSGGSPEKIEKGKKILVWAVIGLAVIFGAYSLVNFVISKVIGI